MENKMPKFPDVNPGYEDILLSKKIPHGQWGMHKKWVRFYLHFCEKYLHNPDDTKSLPLFIEKLASKGAGVYGVGKGQATLPRA